MENFDIVVPEVFLDNACSIWPHIMENPSIFQFRLLHVDMPLQCFQHTMVVLTVNPKLLAIDFLILKDMLVNHPLLMPKCNHHTFTSRFLLLNFFFDAATSSTSRFHFLALIVDQNGESNTRMLSCSLWRSCFASFALAFLVIRDVRVNCCLVSHAKIKYTLGHLLSSLFSIVFFSIRIPRYFQEFGKRHPQALIHSGRRVIFKKKKKIQNFAYPVHQLQHTLLILALVCTPSLALAPCGLKVHSKGVENF